VGSWRAVKATIRCTSANGEHTGTLTVDIAYGTPITISLDKLPRRTRTIVVDPYTPNSVLSGTDREQR
jgi:hypothetical protein